LKLSLLAFGKLRTPGLREAADYYLKLLRPWAPVEEIEIRPLPVPDKSASTRSRIQAEEARLLTGALERSLGARGAFYLLEEGGRQASTQEWATRVREWESQSLTGLAFCVGSSLGFSDELRGRARGVLSLGPQTLPHELARVVLLEQLYRAWSVTRGHPYHNEG
jgi:23S rRNA (pseudouridine1915-N3)-methyltransferase